MKEMKDMYRLKQNQKLRCGYTTGSCSAAAAKAAAMMLFQRKVIQNVTLITPKQVLLKLKVLDALLTETSASCGIQKDAGDDKDATDGIIIYATVKKCEKDKKNLDCRFFQEVSKQYPNVTVYITSSIGVGIVTKKGLSQPVGSYAVNQVPRNMICDAVCEVCDHYDYHGGIEVCIDVPKGKEAAQKTFNQRLGIVDGISILGTSGIVEPMSENALIESIRLELSMKAANGEAYLLLSPGNYGEKFFIDNLHIDLERVVKCSNFIGETIDAALEYEFQGILFVSHIGKLIKTAGGIMNTHSRESDARMELLAANAAISGASLYTVRSILDCTTTDSALLLLSKENCLTKTMNHIMKKVHYYLNQRAYGKLEIEAITFTLEYGELGRTENADRLLERIEKEP